MAGANEAKDMKNAKNWDKKDRVVVRVIDTDVETVVCRGYFEAYKNEGIVYLRDYAEPKPKVAPKVEPKPKE